MTETNTTAAVATVASDAAEREELIAYIFDETKVVEGRKARGVDWDAYTTQELRDWSKRLSEEIRAMIEQERRDMVARNVQRWQDKKANKRAREKALNYKPLGQGLNIPM